MLWQPMKTAIFPSLLCIFFCAIFTTDALASKSLEQSQLFDTNELLTVKIDGPLNQLNKERDKSVTYTPATLGYTNQAGEMVSQQIRLEARGNRRLSGSTCAFSPLRLILDKNEAKGTLFEGQKKLKLVSQCYPKTKLYEQYVITEYLAYRIFNLLTPESYRVRLAKIDFADSESGFLHQGFGFLLEPNRTLAKRIGRDRLKIESTDATKLDSAHLNLVSLFQFMLGNTDWSATHGGNNDCCHNGKIFGEPGGDQNLFIPYDFDLSGLVDPEYALTDPKLKLKNIRDRRYRGYCRNNDYLPEHIAKFNRLRGQIENLFIDSPYLSNSFKKSKLAYINKFYEIINNKKRVDRYIHNWCHQSVMLPVEPVDPDAFDEEQDDDQDDREDDSD